MGAGPSHDTDWSTGRNRERRPGSRSRLGDEGLGSSGSGFGGVSPCTPRSSVMEGGSGGGVASVWRYGHTVEEVKSWWKQQLSGDTDEENDD